MTPEQFIYWFRGFSEALKDAPTKEQWELVLEHFALVMKDHRTPFTTTTNDPLDELARKAQITQTQKFPDVNNPPYSFIC